MWLILSKKLRPCSWRMYVLSKGSSSYIRSVFKQGGSNAAHPCSGYDLYFMCCWLYMFPRRSPLCRIKMNGCSCRVGPVVAWWEWLGSRLVVWILWPSWREARTFEKRPNFFRCEQKASPGCSKSLEKWEHFTGESWATALRGLQWGKLRSLES